MNNKPFTYSKRFPQIAEIGTAFASNKIKAIPLSFGFPAPESFPLPTISEAAVTALATQGPESLQYTGGTGPAKVVEWVTARSKLRSIEIDKSEIIITTGSMQAIDLAVRTLTDPGDQVWIEAPSFFGAIRIFKLAEVELSSFPIDEDGVRVDLIEEALLHARENQLPLPKMLYIMPNYHNPGGINLSLERRKKLAELAHEYNFFILEDDAYVELTFTNEFLPAIYSFAPERVIYLSTFSKIIAPGVRVGWAIACQEVITKMRMLKVDGQTSVFVQEIIHQILDNLNFEDHLADINSLYASRKNAMVDAINDFFADDVSFAVPEGGFFLWLTFPLGTDTSTLLEKSLEAGVNYIPGRHFYLHEEGYNQLRLCFTFCDEVTIREAISKLATTYYQLQHQPEELKEVL
ncbi:PLP-dependent aminotransferase family protein [Bacillus sp. PS06]|uniref:aminotransferase-like domain-containing protein n=1 Tax=Bacillus sp. PS06 TaxID=2764176 RepID=UPI0017839B85|nr:PLP-dependent aminotransferase family protein [Bacillus sp. PS06]MBD8069070.1 PLP-dependent aminotransferase family protein [Bacillus sp. PS06]